MTMTDDVLTHDVPSAAVPPPGADELPGGGGLRQVLAPRWRTIVISVALTLAAALTLLFALPRPEPKNVRVVDPSKAIAQAEAVPNFRIYLPSPLPAGWYPNSAWFGTVLDNYFAAPYLHIGYLTPDHAYIGLEQSNGTPRWRFVSTMTAGNVLQDLVTVDGTLWAHVQSSRKAQESLVWYGRDTVVVVSGTTSLANLEMFAASLHVDH